MKAPEISDPDGCLAPKLDWRWLMPPKKKNPDASPSDGAALIEQFTSRFDMDPSDQALLEKAAFTLDLINELDADIRDNGAVDADGKVRGTVQEARFQRALLLKMLAELQRLSGSTDTNLGTRGSYSIRSVG
jgi:hypothetical protein